MKYYNSIKKTVDGGESDQSPGKMKVHPSGGVSFQVNRPILPDW